MPIEDPGNAGAGYQGSVFDNTLQNCIACGFLAIDAGDRIIARNQESTRAFHVASGTQPLLEHLPAPIQSLIREVRSTGHSVTDRPITVRAGGGDPRSLSVSAIPLASPDGALMLVMFKDVSIAMRLERNLRSLDRLASIGTLSASMAHEIKNALVAVKTFVEMQSDSGADAELARIARHELGRVDSIVSHMLKFATPPAPGQSLVRLHEVLTHSLRLVQHRVGSKMISFQRDFRASADGCSGDDRQLEQAFVNLLFNAVDAIGAEGTLSLSTDLIADEAPAQLRDGAGLPKRLRVKITDTGGGISPENMEHIFEPFFTTKATGTGLGLAVTRQIIREHGGSIHVESQPGKGTTFAILLPAVPRDGAA